MHLSRLIVEIGQMPDRPRPGYYWIQQPYRIHQRLCMAFPSPEQQRNDEFFLNPFEPNPKDLSQPVLWTDVHACRGPESGFLFRVDANSPSGVVILVQSARKPNWKYAFQNARYLCRGEPRVIHFEPCFRPDARYRFRLRANVTRKVGTRTKEERLAGKPHDNGNRVPIFDKAAQLAWLTSKENGWVVNGKAIGGGFQLIDFDARTEKAISLVEKLCSDAFQNDKPKPKDTERKLLHSVLFEGSLIVTDPTRFRQTIESGIGPAKGFGFGLLSVAPAG